MNFVFLFLWNRNIYYKGEKSVLDFIVNFILIRGDNANFHIYSKYEVEVHLMIKVAVVGYLMPIILGYNEGI